jgi:hypothetical protein
MLRAFPVNGVTFAGYELGLAGCDAVGMTE